MSSLSKNLFGTSIDFILSNCQSELETVQAACKITFIQNFTGKMQHNENKKKKEKKVNITSNDYCVRKPNNLPDCHAC